MKIVRRTLLAQSAALAETLHPVLARVYAGRGITEFAQLDHRLNHLLAPDTMLGMAHATDTLIEAIQLQRKILIVGDYDADGATGTTVAVRGLRMLGAQNVKYRVPNRATHGYGLSAALAHEIAQDKPDLLITVDNGIASIAGVAVANAAGIKVLVTDHHLPGDSLPAAAAIINPNQRGCAFESKALAGVGVMFYLLLSVRAKLRELTWFNSTRSEPDLAELLDLVALGTVADMVPLDFNNRILVEAGLRRIRAGKASAGVAALYQVSGRDPSRASVSDFGFALGPRINAAGRLEDMSVGIACLLQNDLSQALQLAQQLDAINQDRRVIQTQMLDQAERLLAKRQFLSDVKQVGVTIFDNEWHPGVVGLLASRIKDQLHRPVIAFAPAAENSDELRGSARSIAGFNIRDALADISALHPDLIPRFGGHAMAAGLTLHAADLAKFTAAFDYQARKVLGDASTSQQWLSDGELRGEQITIDLANQIRFGGPWGQGFAEPMFDNEFIVDDVRVLKEKHLRLDLRFAACDTPVEAMHFFGADSGHPGRKLRAVYQIDADEWRGKTRVKLLIRERQGL